MTTTALLADALGVSPGDVRVLLDWVGHPGGDLDKGAIDDVRGCLDPHGERSVPELYGQAPQDWREHDGPL